MLVGISTAALAASGALAQEPPPEEQLIIDTAAGLVYVPGEGWLDADAFWVLYFHEPWKLPGDSDFSQLAELGYPEVIPPEPGSEPTE